MKWNYKIEVGGRIQQLIDNETYDEILSLLRVELNMFLLYNTSISDRFSFEARQLMYMIADDIESVKDGSYRDTWESLEELVDARLDEFYDFCDDHRIYVSSEDVFDSFVSTEQREREL